MIEEVGTALIIIGSAGFLWEAYKTHRILKAVLDDIARERAELERFKEELTRKTENIELNSMQVVIRSKKEFLEMLGQLEAKLKDLSEAQKKLIEEVERAKNEAENTFAITTSKAEVLRGEVEEAVRKYRLLQEEVGKVHLALLDFENRSRELEKNLIDLEKIALDVATHVEEVLRNGETDARGNEDDSKEA